MDKESQWVCRTAPSLGGGFDGTPESAWGTKTYNPDADLDKPCVFFGMYGLPDFYALWRHRGKKAILWAGSDILHFRKGYWLENSDEGIKFPFQGHRGENPDMLASWINKYCDNYVEDEGEAWQLHDCGIDVKGIIPSFLGDVRKYRVSFRPGNKVYASAHEKDQWAYGWNIIAQIACATPDIEFHLYGASWPFQSAKNVFIHGKVSVAQMNKEIKNMQCGLRLNKHDGFSEITAKSVLWGQYPITYLYYPKIDQYTVDSCGQPWCIQGMGKLVKLLRRIPSKREPNIEARNYYLANLNKYPWNNKQ